jgi:hypothetical protein
LRKEKGGFWGRGNPNEIIAGSGCLFPIPQGPIGFHERTGFFSGGSFDYLIFKKSVVIYQDRVFDFLRAAIMGLHKLP